MHRSPDPAPQREAIAVALLRAGLKRPIAQRMAGEWLDHWQTLVADALAAGMPAAEAADEALRRIGSVDTLLEHCAALPDAALRRALRARVATLARWSGASLGGLTSTCLLLAVMSQMISN